MAIAAKSALNEVIVHTGQHFDENMSGVFFDELGIPKPKYNLEISNLTHGAMTGRMLEGIEAIIRDETPDAVLVYGDTNSTLAGALAAAKLLVPVAHVEAGLRSFNMKMPEEINRALTDRISTLLFCPTRTAVTNLSNEGIRDGVHNVGDVMYDASLMFRDVARSRPSPLDEFGVSEKGYVLATCHRAENTDDPVRLKSILSALSAIAEETSVILPIHPRTRNLIQKGGLETSLGKVKLVEPLPFLAMVSMEQSARAIITDSGGIQKEAYFYRVPCVTVRDETEWVETVESGWNILAGADSGKIIQAYRNSASNPSREEKDVYGDGRSAHKIADILKNFRTAG